MRLQQFINEESPILGQLVKCKDLPEEDQRISCRINIYRKYIIKLKKDRANDQTSTVDKDLKDKTYKYEQKIKKLKFRLAELNRKKVQQRRQGLQQTQQQAKP